MSRTVATCICDACKHEEVIEFEAKVDELAVRRVLKYRGWRVYDFFGGLANSGNVKIKDFCPACGVPSEVGNGIEI